MNHVWSMSPTAIGVDDPGPEMIPGLSDSMSYAAWKPPGAAPEYTTLPAAFRLTRSVDCHNPNRQALIRSLLKEGPGE